MREEELQEVKDLVIEGMQSLQAALKKIRECEKQAKAPVLTLVWSKED